MTQGPQLLAAEMYLAGRSLRQVASELGVSTSTVVRWLKRFEISRRPAHGQRTTAERFWEKVDKDGPIPSRPELGACWIWTGSTAKGYGSFSFKGALTPAHRYSYEAAHGPVAAWTDADCLAALREFAATYGEAPRAIDFRPDAAVRMAQPERAERFHAHDWPTVGAIIPRFGTWNAALIAAGLPLRRQSPVRLRERAVA